MKKILKQTGSIALISTLIISSVIIFIVITMSQIAITGAYKSFNHEAHKITSYAADSCLEESLIRLERDPTFTGDTIDIDADTSCTITINGFQILIDVTYLDFVEDYEGYYTMTTNGLANNTALTEWNEL